MTSERGDAVNSSQDPTAGTNGHVPDAGDMHVVAHGAAADGAEPVVAVDDWTDENAPPIAFKELAELFTAFDKATRARRLYQENNPVYQSFNATLRKLIGGLWDRVASLSVVVVENAFRNYGQEFGARD
jgi:hypothetical protein